MLRTEQVWICEEQRFRLFSNKNAFTLINIFVKQLNANGKNMYITISIEFIYGRLSYLPGGKMERVDQKYFLFL